MKKRGIAANNNNGSHAEPVHGGAGTNGHSQPRQHGGASDQQISSGTYRTQSSNQNKGNYAGSSQIGGGGAGKKENLG